mmetsp:Transcript_7705/g.16586  ORF Transcript_7705/g.16586 Transcript_7705/m.16586 type:complete len:263 (-) Transcript_7705:1205-1993(-)
MQVGAVITEPNTGDAVTLLTMVAMQFLGEVKNTCPIVLSSGGLDVETELKLLEGLYRPKKLSSLQSNRNTSNKLAGGKRPRFVVHDICKGCIRSLMPAISTECSHALPWRILVCKISADAYNPVGKEHHHVRTLNLDPNRGRLAQRQLLFRIASVVALACPRHANVQPRRLLVEPQCRNTVAFLATVLVQRPISHVENGSPPILRALRSDVQRQLELFETLNFAEIRSSLELHGLVHQAVDPPALRELLKILFTVLIIQIAS